MVMTVDLSPPPHALVAAEMSAPEHLLEAVYDRRPQGLRAAIMQVRVTPCLSRKAGSRIFV